MAVSYQFSTLTISSILIFSMATQAQNAIAPKAAQKEKILTIHGHSRVDKYYWLNERENPEVIKYLEDENSYTKAKLAHTEAFQENLFKEIVGRIKQTDMSVPYKMRGYEYYVRYEEGKEYPIFCRKNLKNSGKEEVMLNVNEMAEGHSYFDVTGLTVSPDNNLLAYGVDNVSRRKYTLYIKNLSTGEIYKESVPNTDGSYTWANDNKTLFYDVKDEITLRTFKIRKHILGTTADKDTDVYTEKDETFNCGVGKSKSEKYIFISSFSTQTSEIQYIDANKPNEKFTVVQPRVRDLLYSVEHFGNDFYIRTNADGAKNFKLVKAPVEKSSKANWVDVIPHNEKVLLEGFEIFNKYLVLEERSEGLTKIKIQSWDGKINKYLDFGEPDYSAYIGTNYDFDSEVLRYGFTSLKTPSTVYDYNMSSGEKTLLKQQEVLGGYNSENYITERVWAKATDGTLVPISLYYKKGIEKNGKNNLLLYAYGSYGYSMDVSFSSARLSLVDRGFVFAIAHVRGGQEMGRYWYEDGKLLKKKNTFTDFIDCAEYLIKEKYTSKNNLFAMGGSAGGLLMGAVVNMKPDLWKGVVAQVPFVDVVTTMLDESIPLTTGEFDEWGNPKEKKYYDYMLSYSPYDNVEKKNYPNMLVTTGLHDSQVQYWEPAKWVAKLRELKTDNNILLLHTEMEAGHGGKSGRFERLREIALEYAFILDLVGINQ
jgi:oligopeptidase B